jgi:MFS transporter, DHA1 family, multidrug resistance protein
MKRWSSGRGSGLVSLLVATACFRLTQNMALTTFAALGRDEVRLSPSAIGAFGALTGLMTTCIALLVAARLPARRQTAAAAVGMFLLILELFVFSAAQSAAVFAAGAVVLGVAGGFALPALTTAVGHLGEERQAQSLALFALTLSGSLAVGPMLEWLTLAWSHGDVRAPFLAFLPVPLVGALALVPRRPRHLKRSGTTPPGGIEGQIAQERSLPDLPPAVSEADSGYLSSGPARWIPGASGRGRALQPLAPLKAGTLARLSRRGLLGPAWWRFAVTGQLLFAIPWAAITVFGVLVARAGFGVSLAGTQLGFTALFVVSFGARAVYAWRPAVTRKPQILGLSAVLTAVSLGLLGVGHGLGYFLLAMAVLGLPHGLTYSVGLAQIAEGSSRGALARFNAGLIAVTYAPTVIVPAIMGEVIAETSYRGMVVFLLVSVAAFGALLWVQRGCVAAHRISANGAI